MSRFRILGLGLLLTVVLGVAAACASGGTSAGGHPTGRLLVRVALFGGPPQVHNGGMTLNNKGRPNSPVVVTGPNGHKWHDSTGQDGNVVFTLAPGRYSVTSFSCGQRTRQATVVAGQLVRMRFDCAVP